jgi:hypothetical protein
MCAKGQAQENAYQRGGDAEQHLERLI